MVGTAHSNNGINVQTITFTGCAGADLSGDLRRRFLPAWRCPGRRSSSSTRTTRTRGSSRRAPAWNTRSASSTVGVGELSLRARRPAVALDRHQHRRRRRRSRSRVAETGQALPHYRFAAGSVHELRAHHFVPEQRPTRPTTASRSRRTGASGDLQARAAYTLGKVADTVPDATAVVPGTDDAKFASNPADFDADRAPGNNDQRHRLVLSGVLHERHARSRHAAGGWTFAAIFTAQSGQPYSAYVSNDINLDQNARNDIAPGTTRNQYRLPSQVTFDPRIARDIPVRQGDAAADLGGVQSVQPRQHQRRAEHALQRLRHDADHADELPAADRCRAGRGSCSSR